MQIRRYQGLVVLPNIKKVTAIPKIKSPRDWKSNKILLFFLQPAPKSQWGIKSAIGWEMAERVMPKAGFGTEAAIAPPISACAVAVIKRKCITFCPFDSNKRL